MSTALPPPIELVSSALFGKARRAVLGLLLGHPDETFYLRQIVRLLHVGQGAVQRELGRLVEAGIVWRSRRGNQVCFQANPRCPIFGELRGIVLKTVGLGDVLRSALAPLAGRIQFAFVYGSIARGEPTAASDIDLCIVGDVSFGEIVAALAPAQEALGWEVNPTVYPPAEYAAKLAERHPFVSNIVRGPRIILIGDEAEVITWLQENHPELL